MSAIILSACGNAQIGNVRSRRLRKLGYEVVDADTGPKAVALALKVHPQLILVDLPEAAARDIGVTLKTDASTGSIPLVFIGSFRQRKAHPVKCPADLCIRPQAAPEALFSVIRMFLVSEPREDGRRSEEPPGSLERLVTRNLEARKRELESQIVELARERDVLLESNAELRVQSTRQAHDLLSPLCTISFVSSWIAEEYGDRLGKAGSEHLELLQKSVRRMKSVVESLVGTSSDAKPADGPSKPRPRTHSAKAY